MEKVSFSTVAIHDKLFKITEICIYRLHWTRGELNIPSNLSFSAYTVLRSSSHLSNPSASLLNSSWK